jgi:hypothetical protein
MRMKKTWGRQPSQSQPLCRRDALRNERGGSLDITDNDAPAGNTPRSLAQLFIVTVDEFQFATVRVVATDAEDDPITLSAALVDAMALLCRLRITAPTMATAPVRSAGPRRMLRRAASTATVTAS